MFASYRERVGSRFVEINVPEGSTVGYLAQKIVSQHPQLVANHTDLVVAVNQEFQGHGYVLSDGDEVALIPPVSGGISDGF